ncbi:hypothetical protein [Pseudomonas sp. F1002]|uniref:hypothetical protein n=1 Tax=Pseudomonas sp. F1002 TaxID=2738821 RepID=UPI0015A2B32C|nr:hypothetical protein [Pseudomonas sp. F1002]NWB64070.1 hypothetical protein [Pseudomonas sp. F1002]
MDLQDGGRQMEQVITIFNTGQKQPEDYQECLVFGICEGFQIATWKTINETSGFFRFGNYEPLSPGQCLLWAALPNVDSMINIK